jgi:hypothetical protein
MRSMRESSLIVLAIFVVAWGHTAIQDHHVNDGPRPHVHDEHHDHAAEVWHDVVSSAPIIDDTQSTPNSHDPVLHAHYSNATIRNATPLINAPIPVLGIVAPIQCWVAPGLSGLAVKRGLSSPNPLKPTGLLTTILRR